MTKEQQMVRAFMRKAKQELPDKPTIPDLKTRKLRAKLMLEEVLETINKGLGLAVMQETGLPEGMFVVNIDDVDFIDVNKPDLVELADGIADSQYVELGTAIACGIDMQPIFKNVHDSNLSKFIDGYVDKSGKYRKGKSFRPPDIKNILDKQDWSCKLAKL